MPPKFSHSIPSGGSDNFSFRVCRFRYCLFAYEEALSIFPDIGTCPKGGTVPRSRRSDGYKLPYVFLRLAVAKSFRISRCPKFLRISNCCAAVCRKQKARFPLISPVFHQDYPSRLSTPRLLIRIYVGASGPLSPVVRFPGGRCRNFLFPHPVATTHTVYTGNDQRTLARPLRHRNRLNISRESITRISLRNFPASP